jgi:two-component system, LuxR family, sensor kinase FixL
MDRVATPVAVSDPKEGDAALRAIRRQHRRSLELSPEGILIEVAGRIVFANQALRRLLGITDDRNILGAMVADFVHRDSRDEAERRSQRLRETGELQPILEERWVRPDGEPVDLEVAAVLVPWEGDAAVQLALRDVTARTRLATQARAREAQLASILATVPDAMIVIDRAGLIHAFSAAAERLFGYTADEVTGRNVAMLMPSPHREQHDGYIARYLATGERRVIGIGRVAAAQRRDGTIFPIELAIGEVEAGGQTLFTGFIRDLTETQERERRLHEVQSELIHMSRLSELGPMVSTLAHEVNQPLTAIQNYLRAGHHLATSGELDKALSLFARAIEQSERANAIILRLREFVRKGGTSRQRENLPKIVEEASALSLVGQKALGVRVAMRLDPLAAWVVVDKVQVQQVLFNLLRNAIEAMAEWSRREVVIATAPGGEGMIEISVADTGPGLSEDVRQRLFQPFVTTKPAGMGVGLSICRSIVEAHGGRLSAHDNPGGGTVFRFTIPGETPPERLP